MTDSGAWRREVDKQRQPRGAIGIAGTLILLFTLLPSFAPDRAHATKCRFKTTRHAGVWTRVPTPGVKSWYVEGPPYVVNSSDPRQMFVVNYDELIFRSVDRGCSWKEVFSPFTLAGWPAESIVGLWMGAEGRRSFIYGLLRSRTSLLLTVLLSTDAGDTWERRPVTTAEGVTISGTILGFRVAPSSPNRLYLATGDRGSQVLYMSDDGGASWDERSRYAQTSAAPYPPWDVSDTEGHCVDEQHCVGVPFNSIAVDPLDPDILWTAGKHGIYSSQNSGATWSRRAPIDWRKIGSGRMIDIFHRKGRQPRLAVFGDWGMVWSADGGKSWSELELPKGSGSQYVQSGASGRSPRILLVTVSSGHVFRLQALRWIDITPSKLLQSYDDDRFGLDYASVGSPPDPSYFFNFRDGTHLMMYEPR